MQRSSSPELAIKVWPPGGRTRLSNVVACVTARPLALRSRRTMRRVPSTSTRLEISSNREGLQRAAGNQLQLVQRSCAVGRRRADHPEVSTPGVDLDRCDVAKSRGVGADKVHRMIRALARHDQLAPEPIAKKES